GAAEGRSAGGERRDRAPDGQTCTADGRAAGRADGTDRPGDPVTPPGQAPGGPDEPRGGPPRPGRPEARGGTAPRTGRTAPRTGGQPVEPAGPTGRETRSRPPDRPSAGRTRRPACRPRPAGPT